MSKREYSPDLIRVVGTLLILSIHFYFNNGFYSQAQTGLVMWLGDFGRWFTFICVPLFAMLTGYLKCDALPSGKYYRSVLNVVIIWVLLSVITVPFRIFYVGETKTFWGWMEEFFAYKASPYAWYIEMFIGLSLLAPLVNFIFKTEEKYQRIAIITISSLTFLPSFMNGLIIDGAKIDLIPNYITGFWPVAYYLIGGYIRKHKIKIKWYFLAALLVICPAAKACMTYFSANGGNFYKGIGGGYSDVLVGITTVCLFLLLYKADTKSEGLKKVMAHVSKRSLIIYLMSYVADQLMRPVLKPYIYPETYIYMFFVWVAVIFVITLAISEIIYPLTLLCTGKFKRRK